MKLALILVALALFAYIAYLGIAMLYKMHVALRLSAATTPYALDTGDRSVTLLVLGDSSGVGVGASRPLDSVAGRLATRMSATYVENRAVSGAVVADLTSQLEGATLSHYDAVLVQIGGNDIIRFHDAEKAAAILQPTLNSARGMTNRVYLMSAGNVGAATLFPWFVRPFHTSLNLRYHDAFARVSQDAGTEYVNLYAPPEEDPFTKEPETYLAPDGLHPSSAGYGLWFERLAPRVQKLK